MTEPIGRGLAMAAVTAVLAAAPPAAAQIAPQPLAGQACTIFAKEGQRVALTRAEAMLAAARSIAAGGDVSAASLQPTRVASWASTLFESARAACDDAAQPADAGRAAASAAESWDDVQRALTSATRGDPKGNCDAAVEGVGATIQTAHGSNDAVVFGYATRGAEASLARIRPLCAARSAAKIAPVEQAIAVFKTSGPALVACQAAALRFQQAAQAQRQAASAQNKATFDGGVSAVRAAQGAVASACAANPAVVAQVNRATSSATIYEDAVKEARGR